MSPVAEGRLERRGDLYVRRNLFAWSLRFIISDTDIPVFKDERGVNKCSVTL